MIDVFLILSQIAFLIVVVYLILEVKKKDRLQETKVLLKLYETIEKVSNKNNLFLEKIFNKNNLAFEKTNKEFLKIFTQFSKRDVQEVPKSIEADNVENSIENVSETEEINLADTPRIPIVEGVKIKFEDEEEVYPMNINPIENYKENKKENPIEK